MRVPPTVKIAFTRDGIRYEEVSKTAKDLKFKLHDDSGSRIDTKDVTANLELDAEL
jgi:hypothetical protein